MQTSLLTARAVNSDPSFATDSLFLKEKAFLSENASNRCLIHAHRYLSGPTGVNVHTCARSPEDEIAQQKAVDFKPGDGKSNFSSREIRNAPQLADFLRDRWSDYERPKRATRSSYVLFIDRTTSANALNLTCGLMKTVLSSLQVFPHLKDFVILFDRGEESGERELYPPPCVYREFRSKKHGFECAYAFSHVDAKRKDEDAHVSADTYWPVRRTVVYHKFSLVKARKQEIWIVIGSRGGSDDLRKQILDYQAHNMGSKSNPSPFELHLLIQHCYMGNWRPRLRWMAEEIWRQVNPAITMPIDNSNSSRRERLVRKLLADQSQARQNIWEKLDDSMLAVDALIETIELLKANFLRFEGNPGSEKMSRCQETIARAFDMKKREGEAVLKQLKAMRGKAESTSSLYARLTALQSKSIADQGARNNRITTTLTLLTASFLPTAVLGTFFSGTKIFESPHGHAKYWSIIFGTAIGIALVIWLLGLIYSWWTVGDLAEGLRPFAECLSWMKDKYAERDEKKAEEKEAKEKEAKEKENTTQTEAARVQSTRAETAEVDHRPAWSFPRLRGSGPSPGNVQRDADNFARFTEQEILRRDTVGKLG